MIEILAGGPEAAAAAVVGAAAGAVVAAAAVVGFGGADVGVGDAAGEHAVIATAMPPATLRDKYFR
jgi:hypothetical protein